MGPGGPGWGPGIPESWKAQAKPQMLQFRTGSVLVKCKVMIYYHMDRNPLYIGSNIMFCIQISFAVYYILSLHRGGRSTLPPRG